MIRGVILCAVLLVACQPAGSPPSSASSAECGAVGEPSPWCSGPLTEDPTPGLSPGARAIERRTRGRRRMIAPLGPEIEGLERLLASTPEGAPDHVRLLDRLAEDYFTLERMSYEACREARVPEVATRSALAVEDDRVRRLVDGIRRGHDSAERQCAALARQHPGHAMRAPCGS